MSWTPNNERKSNLHRKKTHIPKKYIYIKKFKVVLVASRWKILNLLIFTTKKLGVWYLSANWFEFVVCVAFVFVRGGKVVLYHAPSLV